MGSIQSRYQVTKYGRVTHRQLSITMVVRVQAYYLDRSLTASFNSMAMGGILYCYDMKTGNIL